MANCDRKPNNESPERLETLSRAGTIKLRGFGVVEEEIGRSKGRRRAASPVAERRRVTEGPGREKKTKPEV